MKMLLTLVSELRDFEEGFSMFFFTSQRLLYLISEDTKKYSHDINPKACDTGYEMINGMCLDIDECQRNLHDCQENFWKLYARVQST